MFVRSDLTRSSDAYHTHCAPLLNISTFYMTHASSPKSLGIMSPGDSSAYAAILASPPPRSMSNSPHSDLRSSPGSGPSLMSAGDDGDGDSVSDTSGMVSSDEDSDENSSVQQHASQRRSHGTRRFATEAELRRVFQERPTRTAGGRIITPSSAASAASVAGGSAVAAASAVSAAGGSAVAASPVSSSLQQVLEDDPPQFDLTEDIFHPMQQMRLRRRRWARRGGARCSGPCVWAALRRNVPLLKWLPSYPYRRNLLPDVLAGLMLGVVCLPQGLAYASLASMPPIMGLYSCMVPPLIYACMGGSPAMHIGPFALVALLTAQAVTGLLPSGAPPGGLYAQNVASLLALVIGVVLTAMSFLRLGFAVSFLSDSVLSAYTCASAVLILTSQWKSLLGIRLASGLGFIETYVSIFSRLDEINGATVLLGAGSLVLLVALDELNARYKFRVPIPSQLVVLVLAISVVYAGGMDEAYGVKVVGRVPSGLPAFHMPGTGMNLALPGSATNSTLLPLPADAAASAPASLPPLLSWSMLRSCLQPACMIALIAYIISISIAKNFAAKVNAERGKARRKREEEQQREALTKEEAKAKEQQEEQEEAGGGVALDMTANAAVAPSVTAVVPKSPEEEDEEDVSIDPNQELLALGLANLLGALAGSFPVAGSLSRSALVHNAGARTPLHNIVAVLLILLVLLWLTPLLYYLPSAALAAIVFVALKSLLLQVHDARRLFPTHKPDFLMWVATFLATLLLDTQSGIAVGLLTSLLLLLKQTSRPPLAELGQLPPPWTDLYRNIRRFPHARLFRGVLIFRFDASLHFANKDFFREQLERACARAATRELNQARRDAGVQDPEEVEAERMHASAKTRGKGMVDLRASWGAVRHQSQVLARAVEAKWRRSGRQAASAHPPHPHQRLGGSATAAGGGAGAVNGYAHVPEEAIGSADTAIIDEGPPSPSRTGAAASSSGGSGRGQPLPPIPHDGAPMDEQQQDSAMADVEAQPVPTAGDSPPPASSSSPVLSGGPLPTLSDCRVRMVVLDCSSIIDCDDSALTMLRALPAQLRATLVFASMKANVRDLLTRVHFFREDEEEGDAAGANDSSAFIPVERPFVTVHEAVKFCRRKLKPIVVAAPRHAPAAAADAAFRQ